MIIRLFKFLPLLIVFAAYSQTARNTSDPSLLRYVGKYETNGFAVQVTIHEGRFVLVVPGSPLQDLIWLKDNKFRSDSFDDAVFIFTEQDGRVTTLVSQGGGNSV